MRCSGSMLVSADDSRVDPDVPALQTSVAPALELGQQPLPGPIRRPPPVSVVDGLPRPVPNGQVTPRAPRPGTPQHSIQDAAMISPRPAGSPRSRPRQMGLECFPLLVGQVMSIMHIDILRSPTLPSLQDTP